MFVCHTTETETVRPCCGVHHRGCDLCFSCAQRHRWQAESGRGKDWILVDNTGRLSDTHGLTPSCAPKKCQPEQSLIAIFLIYSIIFAIRIFTFFQDLIHLWADQSPDLMIGIYIYIIYYISMLVRSADRHIRRSLWSQEEIELYSHILAGLKPLVRGRLDAEATKRWQSWCLGGWKFYINFLVRMGDAGISL